MSYWDREKECMPREDIEKLQLRRLKETVYRVYAFVPSYKEKMDQAGIKPDDINSLEDLNKLPFTTKQDLRDNYPFGLFALPMVSHKNTFLFGNYGKTYRGGLLKRDIDIWAGTARALTCAGANRYSIIQNSYGYGLFTGGLGVHYGAEN